MTSAFRLRPEAEFRRTAITSAEAIRRTGTGRVNDMAAQASDLVPPALEIDPIGVEAMEAMGTLQVPALAVARIDVPVIADE